ncbi:5'-nucleotidase C-terminal domain-containing protein [Nocardioides endophyticus]
MLVSRNPVRFLALVAAMVVSLPVLAAVAAPSATAAVGDEVIAWVEVEDGAISGGPALNSGDHGNFSGTGSYTFRETGMTSTMSVTAPTAGTYPIYVRYAAGPLGADENVTRSMGLLTNGGSRQLMSLPMTSFENWEAWRFVEYDVTLNEGANTVAIQCDRGTDFCRLNFDAIQVGGTAPDPCLATTPAPGYTSLFDGTFESFDGWRKAGAGGFGRQSDCTIRSIRGRGATWFTEQQSEPYTLEVDWRRNDANDDSGVYLASSSRAGADPVGGYRIPIGADTGAIVPTGGPKKSPSATALSGALRPVGQWNTYRLELTRSRLEVYLNGALVNSLDRTGTASPTGFIGLENPNFLDQVDFRQIQIRPDVEVGELAAPFRRATLADGTTDNPGGESTLGNLVAETHRWATRAAGSGGAQIAFVQPGGVAADLLGGPGGYPAAVTYTQAAAVQPSAATLVNLRLTGAQLKTALEQQWQRTAGGTVPAQSFLRLGTSAGFTYTYDPSKAEGSRITGMWLDGAAIAPATSYSVTVNSFLAAGGDNFRAFADGTARQDTGKLGAAAIVDYLEATAGDGPLAPGSTQHSVGVAFPGGSRASYGAGEALSIDLTSLAYSAATDPKDTAVLVTLGGRSLGAFPVDNTIGNEAFDEYGKAAVRSTVPAALAGGPATIKIVGNNTATTVEVPITVAATSTTSVAVAPAALKVRQGSTSVSVTVAAAGGTPSGEVELYVDGARVSTVALVNGTATASVGPFDTVGTKSVTARYLGSATSGPSTSPVATVVVGKAAAKATVKVQPRKIQAKKTKATVAIAVSAQGYTPTGKVRVKVGKKTYTGTLRSGRVTIKLARFTKAGPVRATVTYLGDALTNPVSTTAKITVSKAKKK